MERELEAFYAARAKEYDRVYQIPDRQADLRALVYSLVYYSRRKVTTSTSR